jgi:hypothetical protein
MVRQFITDVFKKFRPKGHELIETPQKVVANFELRYKNLPIGTLSLDNGIWIYEYSEEFKTQLSSYDAIKPLVNFSDVRKRYESTELWPFFAARIPGLNQPQIQKVIEKEHIDETNPVQLLGRFGKSSISSPFLLEVVM